MGAYHGLIYLIDIYSLFIENKIMSTNIYFLQVHIYGDTDVLFKKKENVLLICNHQSSGINIFIYIPTIKSCILFKIT